MIIPVKCFTCGKVLANKYDFYQSRVRMKKFEHNIDMNGVLYLTEENLEYIVKQIYKTHLATPEATAFNALSSASMSNLCPCLCPGVPDESICRCVI